MQREVVLRKVKGQPVVCALCKQEFPSYRILIDREGHCFCYHCCSESPERLLSITHTYKSYFLSIINKLPLPDYTVARQCLRAVDELKDKADNLLAQIRSRIASFQQELNEFVQLTRHICESYMQKVKGLQECSVAAWLKTPPRLIEQDKFIFNMKQKLTLAARIEESLKELKVSIPNLASIKKDALQPQQRSVCHRASITAATKVRASLCFGTSDGRIIYEFSNKQQQLQAHQSLIRVLEYDGQSRLFSGSDDQTIKLWHLTDSQPKLFRVFGSLPAVKSFHRQLVITDDGRSLASSRGQFDQYKIRIWDLESFSNSKTLEGHQGYIKGMVGTGDNRLVTVSEDRYLKVWRAKEGVCENEHFHSCKINFVFVNDSAGAVCMVDESSRLFLLDLNSLALVNAVAVGRKVQLAHGSTYIYVLADRYISIYSWNLDLLERIEVLLTYAATNFVELLNKLVFTDANGTLHELLPHSLQAAAL